MRADTTCDCLGITERERPWAWRGLLYHFVFLYWSFFPLVITVEISNINFTSCQQISNCKPKNWNWNKYADTLLWDFDSGKRFKLFIWARFAPPRRLTISSEAKQPSPHPRVVSPTRDELRSSCKWLIELFWRNEWKVIQARIWFPIIVSFVSFPNLKG